MAHNSLTPEEHSQLQHVINTHHTPNTSTSLLTRRIHAPPRVVWQIVRTFENPQRYKRFIKNCRIISNNNDEIVAVGSVRQIDVVSGLPATKSIERLEILDDVNRVISVRIIGGDHRLRNYCSVCSVNEMRGEGEGEGRVYTVVVESYAVDVPEGNTTEDVKVFVETIVRLNLEKLEEVAIASMHGPHG